MLFGAQMRFWVSGPRLFGRRTGVSFGVEDLRALASQPSVPLDPSQARGCVYVVQRETDGMVKIGASMKPSRRLKSLQTGSPEPLRLAYALDVSGKAYMVERATHRLLDQFRHRSEWYATSLEVAVGAVNAAAFRCGAIPGAATKARRRGVWTFGPLAIFVVSCMTMFTIFEIQMFDAPVSLVAIVNGFVTALCLFLCRRFARA